SLNSEQIHRALSKLDDVKSTYSNIADKKRLLDQQIKDLKAQSSALSNIMDQLDNKAEMIYSYLPEGQYQTDNFAFNVKPRNMKSQNSYTVSFDKDNYATAAQKLLELGLGTVTQKISIDKRVIKKALLQGKINVGNDDKVYDENGSIIDGLRIDVAPETMLETVNLNEPFK
ncbi:hypothetical protein EFL77_09600, partial [Pediococcus pentosaceus]|uniref:hypothetical protein n=1 Tax=Pediococcus pentosaceus TaxID=1255 RepID=UPI00223C4A1E